MLQYPYYRSEAEKRMDTILLHPPLLEGEGFSVLRQNPDRGWRMETYLTLGSNTVMFHEGKTPLGFLDE